MFSVNIRFIIFTSEVKDNQLIHKILSSEQDKFTYPTCALENNILIAQAKKICFQNYVDLKLEWIDHRLLDIDQDNSIISIYYVCHIPAESKLVNGFFIPINQIVFDPILQKASRSI